METYRIFVSSPGDAQFERQRVDRVVARLNGELAGAARLVSVRWETEFYRAHDTFQTQIPPSTDCNIVVAIFRARLGTELPPNFMPMPDGSPYPSGTAYEVLTAIAKRQQGGELPDVFVFRYPEPPLVQLDDEEKADETRRQWDRLKSFFARWFQTSDGHFKAAFQTFTSTDDFEASWIGCCATGSSRSWQTEAPSPGPSRPTARRSRAAIVRSQICAGVFRPHSRYRPRRRGLERGEKPFPHCGRRQRLRQVIAGARGTCSAADYPGRHSKGGPLARGGAAAERQSARSARCAGACPHAGRGRSAQRRAGPIAGPPGDRRRRLRHARRACGAAGAGDAAAVKPILGALDRVAEQERRGQAIGRPLRCDLVILIDQLDELFSASVGADERKRFAVSSSSCSPAVAFGWSRPCAPISTSCS